MEINFFYHDLNLKQIWSSQRADHLYDKINFGDFRKETCPFGYSSVLIFIDHCDFDSVEKVKAAFYGSSDESSPDFGKKGIVGTGLTATKSVFVDASDTENLGLEDKEYLELIKKINREEIEIVPHSLRPKTSFVSKQPELLADLKIMSEFNPKVWVDHGYPLHNITRYGWDKNGPNYILDSLIKNGYRFFWSRIDYSLNAPDGNLNLLNIKGRAGKDYWQKVVRLFKKGENISKIIFVFFWDFIGNLLGFEAKDDLLLVLNRVKNVHPYWRTFKRVINPLFYLGLFRKYFHPDWINSQTVAIYPVTFDKETVYYFNSLWINDCINAYAPENIDRLIREKGIHLGHNYFCVEEPHYLNLSVVKEAGHYVINEKFQSNLDYIAERQKLKEILVTTVGAYGNFYRRWLKVEITKLSNNRIKIINHNNETIEGLTVSTKDTKGKKKENIKISRNKKFRTRSDNGEIYIWFDLIPQEELILEVI